MTLLFDRPSMSNILKYFGKKMSGFVFQEIIKHIMQNPAHTIMHEAVAKK